MDWSPVLRFHEPHSPRPRSLRSSPTMSTDTGGNLCAHILICVICLSTLWRRIGDQRYSSTQRHYMERYGPFQSPAVPAAVNESPVPVRCGAACLFSCLCLSVFHEINKWSDVEWTEVIFRQLYCFRVKWSVVSYGEVLEDKSTMYSTLGWPYTEGTWL